MIGSHGHAGPRAEAVGMDDEAEPADGFFERFEETLAVGRVAIDVLTLVPLIKRENVSEAPRLP